MKAWIEDLYRDRVCSEKTLSFCLARLSPSYYSHCPMQLSRVSCLPARVSNVSDNVVGPPQIDFKWPIGLAFAVYFVSFNVFALATVRYHS